MFDPNPLPVPASPPRGPEAAPVDVEALCERVRETARQVGGAARAAVAPAPFPAPGDADPDHHLWKNGAVWWIAFTAHAGVVQERVRFSLGTRDPALARLRRDTALRLFSEARGLGISLRFRPQGRPREGSPSGESGGPPPCESGSSRGRGRPLGG